MKTFQYIFIAFLGLLIIGCSEEEVTNPKPRAYPRVFYPEKVYHAFNVPYCNMTFEYPTYVSVEKDSTFFNEKPANPCWFNLYVPQFDCYVYCTYADIKNEQSFVELIDDSFKMAYKHDQRANYIEERKINNINGLGGMQFEMSGPAATPMQFFITDSTTSFLRGAMYFKTQVRPDSLQPVYAFMKKDIYKMIETFKFSK